MSLEAWGDEPPGANDPHPLDSVEFPRQRKRWKRDREAVMVAMRRHENERYIGGYVGHLSRVRSQIAARHEIRRCLLGIDKPRRMHFAARHEFYLRLHRYVRAAGKFKKVPLP